MNSNRSSAEESVTTKDPSGIDPYVNASLHAEDQKLELGNPEKVIWPGSFGEGELENLKIGDAVDPVFEAKAAIINSAFQQIGMGKYQWKLFALCGFGWVSA